MESAGDSNPHAHMRDGIGRNAERFDVAFGEGEGDPFAHPRALGEDVAESSINTGQRMTSKVADPLSQACTIRCAGPVWMATDIHVGVQHPHADSGSAGASTPPHGVNLFDREIHCVVFGQVIVGGSVHQTGLFDRRRVSDGIGGASTTLSTRAPWRSGPVAAQRFA